MNPARTTSNDLPAARRAVVRETILRLKTDLLDVETGVLGASDRQLSRFIDTLAELGPVFSHFGRYLGNRYDLFRPEVCQGLLGTGAVNPLLAEDLERAYRRHHPETEASWLCKLRPEAERSSHLTHYYRWPGRPHLSLRLTNTEFLELWDTDQQLLDRLGPVSCQLWPHLPLKEVLGEFRESVAALRDLDGLAATYTNLANSERDRELLGSGEFTLPVVADEFCGPGILAVLEPAPGASAPTAHAAFAKLAEAGQSESTRIGLARDLCSLWLRHVLRGSWFPVDLTPANLGVDAEGNPSILGGPAALIDQETQEFLFRYLCAVAANQPDIAADVLISHIRPTRRAKDRQTVRDLLRQIIPFRDGQINKSGDHELFAEHVVIQLRAVRQAGYPIRNELLSFQQSFAAVARIAHELSPRRDTFKDALYEFRWTDSLTNLRNLFTLSAAASQGQAWLNLMMEIPEKMNQAAKGQGIAQGTYDRPEGRQARPAGAWISLLSHAFLILVLSWLVHAFLSHERSSPILLTLLVASIVGTGISMIRSLGRRDRSP